jgi:hypothetical protein
VTDLPKPTLAQSVAALRGNPYFSAIVEQVVIDWEAAVRGLGSYKDVTELQKLAAEITAGTEFLDRLSVPIGVPPPV